jgi:hypothetical protein
MNFETSFTGTIKPGDLISVALNDCHHICIYAGRGKTGTIQFYGIRHLAWKHDENPKLVSTRYLKGYVNAAYPSRIIKIDPNLLDSDNLEMYRKSLIFLEKNNIKF